MSSPPLKWHGGKHYLAKWIQSFAPPHTHRVHTHCGGLGEFWNWPHDGVSEVVNDINISLTNFWRVLADDHTFSLFTRKVQAIPCSEVEWEELYNKSIPACTLDVDAAVAFFVRYRQSRQGLGECFNTLSRNRTRRGINEQASSWLSAVDGLREAHERLSPVVIYNKDAIELILQQDGPNTLYYLDPTYHPDTRVSKKVYEHEMTVKQHEDMLKTLSAISGKFILSGYDNELYRQYCRDFGWRLETRDIDNKASSKKEKDIKTECLWMNF